MLSLTFCKGQTPVIDIFGNQAYGTVNGAYYKDVNGFLNQYIGTWLYTNGTTSVRIEFQKREQKLLNGIKSYYEDMLVGEYQYIENGIERVNTLSQISTDFGTSSVEMRNHHLIQNTCIHYPLIRPQCFECYPNEKRLRLLLTDPNFNDLYGLANSFVIRKFEDNSIQKLKVWFYSEIQVQPHDENFNQVPFNGFNLPFGEYTLIKQP